MSVSNRLRLVVLAAGLLSAPLVAVAAGAQEMEALAAECGGGSETLEAWCLEVALAARAAQGEAGLLASGGSDLPGAASTLGWRLGTTPRVSGSVRLGWVRARLPEIRSGSPGPARETTALVPAVHAQVGMGVFQGFSPVPTVGGVLSVDLLAGGGYLFLPGDEGFDGGTAGWSIGARVGLLRESFTLPGVSVSLTRRGFGEVTLGGPEDEGEAAANVSATSVRATVGKDLFSLGILAGVGWERYTGDLRIRARVPGQFVVPDQVGTAVADAFDHSRWLYWGAVSKTFLIVQLSAEVGWANGYDAVRGRPGGGYDPTSGTLFGGLAVRVTY